MSCFVAEVTDLFDAIKELFSDIADEKMKEQEHKIFIELNDKYSFRDIIDMCKDKKLHYDYLMKIWVLPDKLEEKSVSYLLYHENTLEFELAYIYPLDETASKDYHANNLSIDDIYALPFIDEKIYMIDIYCREKFNWNFIRDTLKRPQFSFVVANIVASDRFSKSGITDNGEVERFDVKDDEKSSEWSVIEYQIDRGQFTIITAEKKMHFYCEYKDMKWRYLVDDEVCVDISEVFDIYWAFV